jgi:hypothetical protein
LLIIVDMRRFLRSNQISLMFNLNLNLDGSVVHRISFFLRFILALVAGAFISINGESQPFKELFKLPGYWPALLSSVAIALIAIEQVNFSTIRLHRRFLIYDKEFVKIKRQVFFCFILPFVTVFGLATVYYAYYGYFILDTMWLTYHGWQILAMLLLLNVSFALTRIVRVPEVTHLEPLSIQESSENEIVYVTHDNGINKGYNENGGLVLIPCSLKDQYKLLNKRLYILNPQNSIIRLTNILVAYDIPCGKTRVELITPPGTKVDVSGRQRKFYLPYFK